MILSRPVDRIQTTGCVRESQEVLLARNIACCTRFTLRADPTASFSAPDATFAHTSTSELGFWSRATRDAEIASRSLPRHPTQSAAARSALAPRPWHQPSTPMARGHVGVVFAALSTSRPNFDGADQRLGAKWGGDDQSGAPKLYQSWGARQL